MTFQLVDITLKKQSSHRLYTLHKNSLILDQKSNGKIQTIKLVKDSTGETLVALEYGDDIRGVVP